MLNKLISVSGLQFLCHFFAELITIYVTISIGVAISAKFSVNQILYMDSITEVRQIVNG